jgi:hypothetical protein
MEDTTQERHLLVDGAFGAHLVTAVAADATIVVVARRLATTVREAEGFVGNGTGLDAATALDAAVGVDDGAGEDGVLDDVVVGVGGVAVDGLTDDLEVGIDEALGGVTDELDVALLEMAEPLPLTDDIGGDELRIEGYDPAKGSVDGDGVIGEDEDAHGTGVAAARTVAFHGDDAVHDVEPRTEAKVELYEESAEGHHIRELDMVEGLALPGDGAEEVLDGTSDAGELVGLHLGKVDDSVTFLDGLGDREARNQLAPGIVHPAARGEVDELGPAASPSLHEASTLGSAGGTIQPGGVAEADGRTALLKEAGGRGKDRGVGGDDLVWIVPGEQVWLEEEALTRCDEAVDATEELDAAAQRLVDEIRVIGRTPHQGDGRLAHNSLHGRQVAGDDAPE